MSFMTLLRSASAFPDHPVAIERASPITVAGPRGTLTRFPFPPRRAGHPTDVAPEHAACGAPPSSPQSASVRPRVSIANGSSRSPASGTAPTQNSTRNSVSSAAVPRLARLPTTNGPTAASTRPAL